MKKLLIVILLLAALPLSASARYYGGGSHVSVGVGFGYGGGGYYPGYYAPYYPAYPAYYPPAYPAPVVVEQDPYGAYARPAAPPPPPPQAYDQGYCREFTQNINVDGHIQKAYGTSCRQPDGTWRVVSPAE